MFCQKCGKDNAEGAKFCVTCGASLDFSESATNYTTSEMPGAISQDSKNIALITWLGTIFFGFIPGLIFYLIKKEDPYIQEQAKEALNWSITAMIGYVAGFILTFILIGFLVFLVLGICHLVFCVMGAISTSNGKNFKVPYAIRLIK